MIFHAEHEAVRTTRLTALVLTLTPDVLDADIVVLERTVDQITVCIDRGFKRAGGLNVQIVHPLVTSNHGGAQLVCPPMLVGGPASKLFQGAELFHSVVVDRILTTFETQVFDVASATPTALDLKYDVVCGGTWHRQLAGE